VALGATPRSVGALVVKESLKLTAMGAGLGLVAAAGLGRFLRNVLYEVSPFDPVSFAAVAAMLVAVGLMACWLPARRAARTNPMQALRSE
jgi:putative ABC transport system permease protein